MITAWEVFQASAALLAVYGVAIFLRWKNILKSEHEAFLSGLLMNVCIPAAVFSGLARQEIAWHLFFGPLVMYSSEIFAGLLAFIVGSFLLRLKPPQLGSLILCSAFGSATTVGMAFIEELYQGHWLAFTEAIITAQIGVAALIFLLGAPVAIIFGGQGEGREKIKTEIMKFLRSPIFIALIAGILWSALRLPDASDKYMGPVFQFLGLLQGAIALLAGLAVGLMIRPVKIRSVAGLVLAVVMIKLVLAPLFTAGASTILGFEPMWRGVLVLISAMPSAVIAALFARKYGCDASLASTLVIATTIVSVLTLPVVYSLSIKGF